MERKSIKYYYNFLNNSFLYDQFYNSSLDTISTSKYLSSYRLNDSSIVILNIYDTSGREKFRQFNESFYGTANFIILIYDITDRESFNSCKNYFSENIKILCKKQINILLLGNKNDLINKREVSFEEAEKFAFDNNYYFMETSCLHKENVFKVFEKIVVWNKKGIKN